MSKELCFGIIPLKRKEDGWEVFLVKHNKGQTIESELENTGIYQDSNPYKGFFS